MPGKPVGTVFVELDLDQTKYTKAQQAILQSAKTTSLDIEKNWKIIGEKSDVMYNAMRQSITNAYEMIKNKAGTSAQEIVRAEEAKNTKLKQINEQQFGHQTSLLDSLKKNWIAVTATAMAVYAAVIKPIEAYMESEKALLKMGMAMKNQGDYTRAGLADMEAFSKEIQRLTGFEDDATLAVMANMKSYGMSNEEVKRATKAALDLAIAKENEGMTIERASEILGKSYLGITTGLKKMGIQVDENIPKSQLFESVIKQLNERFGGSAQADLETYLGQWKKLKNEWGDTKEFLGLVFLKTIEALKTAFFGVSTAFWAVVTGITQGLTWIAKGLEAFQRAIGMKEAAESTKSWSDSLQWATDSAKAATVEAARLTSENSKSAISFNNVTTAIDKMGISGKRTTAIDEEAAKAAKKAAEERDKAYAKAFDEVLREQKAEDDYAEQQIKNAIEIEKVEKKAVEEIQKAEKKAAEEREKEIDVWIKSEIEAYAKVDRENEDFIKDEKKRAEDLQKDQIKLATERLSIVRKMTEDIGKFTKNEYDLKKELLDEQYNDYSKFVTDKYLLDRWYDIRLIQLEEERALRSNNFFAGMKVQMAQNSRDQIAWGQVGANVVKKFTDDAKQQLSDNLFNFMTGKFGELKLDWNSLWEGMLRTLTDKLAEMAIQTATAKVFDLFGPAWDWVGSIFAAKGIWDVEGAREGIPVIAHPGEMIIPADLAELIRQGSGGESFEAFRDTIETGGKIPGLEAFMVGTAKEQAKLATIGGLMTATGKISFDQFVTGLFSPQALMSSAIIGGIPEATKSLFGLDKATKYGYSIATMGLMALGVPGLLGALGGILGMGLTEAIMDALNARQNEAIKDFLEEEMGWLDAHLEIGAKGVSGTLHSYAESKGYARTSGGVSEWLYGGPMAPESYETGYRASGGEAGEGGTGQGPAGGGEAGGIGFKYGGIARGPESGYWARLHGTEKITPLGNGNGAAGERTINNFNGPLINVEGPLVTDDQTLNDFAKKIDYLLNKMNKRVYTA